MSLLKDNVARKRAISPAARESVRTSERLRGDQYATRLKSLNRLLSPAEAGA